MPSSHPSLGLSAFFLSFFLLRASPVPSVVRGSFVVKFFLLGALDYYERVLFVELFLLDTGLARTATGTNTEKKEFWDRSHSRLARTSTTKGTADNGPLWAVEEADIFLRPLAPFPTLPWLKASAQAPHPRGAQCAPRPARTNPSAGVPRGTVARRRPPSPPSPPAPPAPPSSPPPPSPQQRLCPAA